MKILNITKKIIYFIIIFLSLYILAYYALYDNEEQKTITEVIVVK